MPANDEPEKITQFQQPQGNQTPRELLMRALQDVEGVDNLIIIGHKNGDLGFVSGTTPMDAYLCVGLVEAFKARILSSLAPLKKTS